MRFDPTRRTFLGAALAASAAVSALPARADKRYPGIRFGYTAMTWDDADQIALHAEHAQFVKDTGGLYLQMLDELKAYPRTVTPDECKKVGALLTEIGK